MDTDTHTRILEGGCCCGRVHLAFTTATPPQAFRPRACDCSFCSARGIRYVSDPHGSLLIEADRPDTLREHRQGSRLAQFLLCRHCDQLIAVVFADGDRRYGTLNADCLHDRTLFPAPDTVSPGGIAAPEDRVRRWTALWTPQVELRFPRAAS